VYLLIAEFEKKGVGRYISKEEREEREERNSKFQNKIK
jgi:hypothetical protein